MPGLQELVVREVDVATIVPMQPALTERYAPRLDRPFFRAVKSLPELRALPATIDCIELRGLEEEAAALRRERPELHLNEAGR